MNNDKNAAGVLAEVDKLIADYEAKKALAPKRAWGSKPRYRMSGYKMTDVFDNLSIFDWWTETLPYTKLLQMRAFLREAIKLGFTGYVCFKVGASGCANGMWAHTAESEDGHSPSTGEVLYRSFTPDYTCWSFTRNGEWIPSADEYERLNTVRKLEREFFGF